MDALKQKWNSRRGASILLALLFLLVCMLAGASILMAAASNAGKVRSNKEEQQKYLTLSSAMNLLVDELESVEYVGTYTYTSTPCHGEGTDEDGNIIYEHINHHIYFQQRGELRLQPDFTKIWDLKEVLPLYNDLDLIFASNFKVPENEKVEEDDYIYDTSSTNGVPKGPYTLKLTVDFTEEEKEFYGGLADQVSIIVELNEDGTIVLTATLMEEKEDNSLEKTNYTMKALLRPDPDEWPVDRLDLVNSPGANGIYETESIKWTLEYIYKGDAENG